MAKKYSIDDIQAYAKHLGGKCLSKEYINYSTLLEWRCEKGHIWDADFQIIKQGSWCPACLKQQKNKEEHFEKIKSIAKEKKGKCLSKDYINGLTKLKFECKEGHLWMMASKEIKVGQWCPKCGRKSRVEKAKTPINVFHKIAKEKGGKLLSKTYINGHSKLLWECSKGHQWQADGAMVLHAKSWCPYCVGKYKNINDMHNLAAKKGGKCLSKKYINSSTKLKWQCDKGHIWNSAPNNVASDYWCPTCGYHIATEKQKDSIEKYQNFASNKSGKLISDKYINNRTPLIWECKKGHKWKARPANVYHLKSWCPYCFDIYRGRKVRTMVKI